jgi:hypothetical protein
MASQFTIVIEPELGGRWASLRDPSGREWLWSRPHPARADVVKGGAYVDVGGIEECLPTIGLDPDHGFLWSQPWEVVSASVGHRVDRVIDGDVTVERSIRCTELAVSAVYTVRATPGYRFVWAAHASLELSVGSRILAEPGPARIWLDRSREIETAWPEPGGVLYSDLGPDDGTAAFCLLRDRCTVQVADGDERLRFSLECDDQPVSIGLWRNLGGWSWDGVEGYRSVAVEPLLGRVFDIRGAAPGETAVVPSSGVVTWTLTIDNGDPGVPLRTSSAN